MNIDALKFRVWYLTEKKYLDEIVNISQDGMVFYFSPRTGTRWFFSMSSINIERCTGMKDKYGKLIYDGDVVSVYNPMTESYNQCRVAWEDEIAGYVCRYLHPEKVERGCAFASTSGTYLDGLDCEVIGNIHEKEGEK